MNTNNNMNRSQNFALTKGLAKMGSDFFDNKLTGKNCIPAAFSAVISIPIFALAVAGDMVYGALKAMGNGLSLLAQRTVKVAPLPSALSSTPNVAAFTRPSKNDPAALIKYFLTTENKDEYATTFKTSIDKRFVSENANFLLKFYEFQNTPSLEVAKDIYLNFMNISNSTIDTINISDALNSKIKECLIENKLIPSESKESNPSESKESNPRKSETSPLDLMTKYFTQAAGEVVAMLKDDLLVVSTLHPEIEREPTASRRAASNSPPPPPVDSSHDLPPPPVPSLSSDSEPTFLSSTYVQNSVDAETLSSPVTVHTEPKQNS